MKDNDRVLFDLVKAAIALAIVRHDLETNEELLDQDMVEQIAQDVWGAMNGVGTCETSELPELTAAKALLGEKLRICSEELGRKAEVRDAH